MKPENVRPSISFDITGKPTLRMRVGLAICRLGAWLIHNGGVKVSIDWSKP